MNDISVENQEGSFAADYDPDENEVKGIFARRSKRETETEDIGGQDETSEIQSIFGEMMETLVEGGKKILKKFTESLDKEEQHDIEN